jgi:Xaa-Pro aminopeptidase
LYKYKRESGALPRFINSLGVTRIGLEAHVVTVAQFSILQRSDAVQWVELESSVEALRFVKSAEEIATIRTAAQITDLAMEQVNAIAKPGMSEKALAWELEKRMHAEGADGLSFATIVASGINGAKPHHRPGSRELQIGDAITIDMGASVAGYHSDMTRTFHLGDNPEPHFWEVYNTVFSAEQTAIHNMRAGMTGAAIDSLARDIIVEAGYGDAFVHSLGHGVGLEIHEGPGLSDINQKGIIPAGATVTVEPGIYLPGWSGVRIEDLVLVTETGSEAISRCSHTPIIPV